MPRMCMGSGLCTFAIGGVAVLIRVVIVVVVAFAAEVHVIEDDAEDSGADRRKFVAGALDRLAGIPAAMDDKDDAVDHGGEDHGVGDTAQWRRVQNDVVVALR